MEKEAYLKIKEKLMQCGVQCMENKMHRTRWQAMNQHQIPDLNQTTEEGTGENEWLQDDEGLNLARRWDEIIATELENLRTEGNGQEQTVSRQRGRPPRRPRG
ncbi:unnamed protein product [Microthlaspi erraticum]|uniref:Uncharacterized protein n=1 Tax=Microthlaspi erraticum TaxID=1685480 RepID=A0A6D2L7D4_9BRAS|nr:unnamed protein product [Microthlaspi erraticum]